MAVQLEDRPQALGQLRGGGAVPWDDGSQHVEVVVGQDVDLVASVGVAVVAVEEVLEVEVVQNGGGVAEEGFLFTCWDEAAR